MSHVDQEHIDYEFGMLYHSIMNFNESPLMVNFCTIAGYNCIRNLFNYLKENPGDLDMGTTVNALPEVKRVLDLMDEQIHSLGPKRTAVMADKLALRDMFNMYKILYANRDLLGIKDNPHYQALAWAITK